MWRCPDIDAQATVARKTGLKKNDMNSIFNELCLDKRDSVWIDMTANSPAPNRINGYNIFRRNPDL